MTPSFTKSWGPSEYAAGIEILNGESSNLEAQLLRKMASDKIPTRPRLQGGDSPQVVMGNFDTMSKHVIMLRSLVNLSAEIEKSAEAPQATTSPVAQQQSSAKAKWDPDAAILAARGVTSYAELNNLPVPKIED
jgi:predicted component of type VI protein secretion system